MSVRENERIALVFCPEPRDTAFLIAHWLGICHLPCHPPFLLPPFRLSPQQISTLFFKLFHLTCPRNDSCSPPLPRSFADTYSGHFQVFHKGSRASDIHTCHYWSVAQLWNAGVCLFRLPYQAKSYSGWVPAVVSLPSLFISDLNIVSTRFYE